MTPGRWRRGPGGTATQGSQPTLRSARRQAGSDPGGLSPCHGVTRPRAQVGPDRLAGLTAGHSPRQAKTPIRGDDLAQGNGARTTRDRDTPGDGTEAVLDSSAGAAGRGCSFFVASQALRPHGRTGISPWYIARSRSRSSASSSAAIRCRRGSTRSRTAPHQDLGLCGSSSLEKGGGKAMRPAYPLVLMHDSNRATCHPSRRRAVRTISGTTDREAAWDART